MSSEQLSTYIKNRIHSVHPKDAEIRLLELEPEDFEPGAEEDLENV